MAELSKLGLPVPVRCRRNQSAAAETSASAANAAAAAAAAAAPATAAAPAAAAAVSQTPRTDGCDYPSCDKSTVGLRECDVCGRGHHHYCAANRGWEDAGGRMGSSLCFTCAGAHNCSDTLCGFCQRR